MANDMELQLSFTYSKKELNAMLTEMENVVNQADLDPNITGDTKKQLEDFRKQIQKFVKATNKDFDKLNAVNLDSKAFDQYVKITDKRLVNLEDTVLNVINTLKGVDSSTDLAGIGNAFDKLKEKVLANNTAIKEMVDTASELGAKVKLDVLNDNQLDEFIAKNKEIRESFEKDYTSSVRSKSGYDKLLDSLKKVNGEVNEITKKRDAIQDTKSLEYLKLDTQRNELLAKRYELAEKVLFVESAGYDFIKEESKFAVDISSRVQNTTKRIDESVRQLEEFREAQKEGYSIVSSEELGGAKGNIPLRTTLNIVTTSQEMFDTIRAKLAKVQSKVDSTAIVVPVKYVLGGTRENSKNPLAPSKGDIKKAQKSQEEMLVDFNKTYAQIEQKAIDEATEAATKSVKTVQEIMNANPVQIKFDIAPEEINRVSDLLASKYLDSKIDIGKALGKAITDAEALAKLMQEIYDKGLASNLKTNYAKEIKAVEDTATPKKTKKQNLNQFISDAKDILATVQSEIFDKLPAKIRLKLKDGEVETLRTQISNLDLGKDLDIAASLKQAVISSHQVAENLNSIKETNIKISGGRGSKADLSNIEGNISTVILGLKTVNDSIGKVQTAIKNIDKQDKGVKKLSVDFGQITSKVDELMSVVKALTEDIRLEIGNLDTAFKELGTTISSTLENTKIHTIADELNGIDLSSVNKNLTEIWKMLLKVINAIDGLKDGMINIDNTSLEKQATSLTSMWEMLLKVVNALDGLKATLLSINGNSFESQWQSIASTFHSVADYADNIDLRKSKSELDEMLRMYKKYRDMGGTNSLNMLTSNTDTLEKLQKLSDKINGSGFNLTESFNNIDTEILNETRDTLKQIDITLSSITDSLKGINGLDNVSKTFNSLAVSDKKLEQIQKVPGALNQIAEEMQELNNVPTFKFVQQIGKIVEQGEGLKALADILKNSQKKIQAAMDIATGNNQNKKELKSQITLLDKYEKKYQSFAEKESEYSEAYSSALRDMETALSRVEKYRTLFESGEMISAEEVNNAKQLEENLSSIADTLQRISKSEISATDKLKNSLKAGLSTAAGYERTYARSWGFGKIEEGYTSDYGAKLKEIRGILNDIEAIRSRFEQHTYLESDLETLTKLNTQLDEEFQALVKIEQISKNTTTTNLQNKIAQYIQKNTRLTSAMYSELIGYYEELGQGAKLTKLRVNEIATAFNNVSLAAKTAGLEGAGFLDAVKNKLKYGWAESIAMFFSFYDIIRYTREISTTVTELNSSLIELSKVSDTSIGQLYNDFSDFRDIAKDTGGTINDVINSTADWARNGYNLPDSKELARITEIYKAIGDGISNDQANEYLVSTLKGFKLQAKDAVSIIDQMNNVSNNAAISMAGLGEGLERSSSALNAANTDLAESIAIITTASEIIQSPDTVGTGLKSMSARLRGATTELEEMGEETTITTSKLRAMVQALTGVDIQKNEDEYKSVYEILLEIGKAWENLTDIEQAKLACVYRNMHIEHI